MARDRRRTTTTKTPPKRTKPTKVSRTATQDGPPEVAPGHRDAHVSAPVRGCVCLQCRAHRAAWRRKMADHVLAALWDLRYPRGSGGRVRAGGLVPQR